jgi:hypothetical protein
MAAPDRNATREATPDVPVGRRLMASSAFPLFGSLTISRRNAWASSVYTCASFLSREIDI